MIRLILGVVLSIGLSSCATEAKYQEYLKSYMGKTETQVVQAWGVPDKTYETGSKKYLGWRKTYGYTPKTDLVSTIYTPYATEVAYCDVELEFSLEVAVGWRYQGNSCKMK